MEVVGNLHVSGNRSLILLATDFLKDKEFSGHYIEQEVGENVSFGNTLYFDFYSSTWKISENNDFNKLSCRGLALEDCTSGNICRILRMGSIRNDAWTFTSNVIYVSTNGQVTTTQPTASGTFIQVIGSVIGEKLAFLDFTPTLIENA